MSKTIREMGEELAGKRKLLSEQFNAKPVLEWTDEEVSTFQQKDAELNDLQAKYEARKKIEEAGQKNLELLRNLEAPANDGLPFAGSNAGGKNEGRAEVKSLGELFIDSPAFKEFVPARKSGPLSTFDVKTVFATSGANIGFAPEVTRVPGLVVDYKLRQPIMDLILPVGRTTQQAIQYMEEQAPVNGATFVGENDTTTGESAISYVEKTVNVKKVRISIPVTDEMMADAPMMMDFVNTRLLNLLALKKDDSILRGSGSGQEILGLLNTSGIQTQALGADPVPDAIHKALTKISVNAFLEPDYILMHPNDWQDVRLLRTNEGVYIYGSPTDPSPDRMWGYNVTKTQAMTEGTALVGAFGTSAQQFIRQDVTMLVSSEHNDNFMRGLLTIKAELRLALVVFRPAGLCTVTGI